MDSVADLAGREPMPAVITDSVQPLPGVLCTKCGADVKTVGFVVETVEYQGYIFQAGKLVKGHKAKSRVQFANCGMCQTRVNAPIGVLIN